MESDYYKYISDFLKYFKYIIKKYDSSNKELNLIIIEEYEKETDIKKVEQGTNLLHMYLYRDKKIKFIDYFNFQRCCEGNMVIPI